MRPNGHTEQNVTIMSMSCMVFLPEIEEAARQKDFKYQFVPAVAYNEKRLGYEPISDTQLQVLPINFSLYESGIPIEMLTRYVGDLEKQELSLANRAFTKLRGFAVQCAERTLADMCTQIILGKLLSCTGTSSLVVFVQRLASDKMIGRLAHLYLDMDQVNICFVSYEPEDLVTTVMSNQTGKLVFDVHRLLAEPPQQDITRWYPGSALDSLVQSCFFRQAPQLGSSWDFLPTRLDVFCQGLTEPQISDRVQNIRDVLVSSKESIPYEIRHGARNPTYVKIPVGLAKALDAWQEAYSRDYVLSKIGG